MSHDHGHGHGGMSGAVSASSRYLNRMAISLAVLLVFLVLEVVVGLLSDSLALLSDAAHMFTDVLGLGMAMAAILAARRSGGKASRTFGLYRLEVLAALANAALLFGVAGWILYEAVGRFLDPPEVPGLPVMLTAAAGLGANLVAFALLRRGAQESINVRGAYLEVLADTLGSLGVLLSGAVTLAFGWRYADPIVGVAIGLFVLPRTARLAAQALRILVQQAPRGLDVRAIECDLEQLPALTGVHDLHVWTLTSGMEVLTTHICVGDGGEPSVALDQAQQLLAERYGIDHATIQVERPADSQRCEEMSW
ncbi:MAG: cation diffusion facilitator family transporter [Pseudonocardiaceae bacterium]|nr:cation diffusion facilitator family transporter [Pseudonocardiaceae bacterium]